ncbi:MAG: cation-efflux pump, partial [Acidocella sp.]|nr:cation-efflux pump [Acidocella sp.]
MHSPLKFAVGSLVVGLTVLSVKAAAWQVSGSAALYSDALESLVNVFAAVMVIFALRTAAK